MAIEKKGKTDFLRDVDAAKIADTEEDKMLNVKAEGNTAKAEDSKKADTDKKAEVKAEEKVEIKKVEKKSEEKKSGKKESSKKKDKKSKNGRPRKLLIDGEKEKSITLQLPKSLIKALKKLAKKSDKSMKEVIGGALLEKYGDLLKK